MCSSVGSILHRNQFLVAPSILYPLHKKQNNKYKFSSSCTLLSSKFWNTKAGHGTISHKHFSGIQLACCVFCSALYHSVRDTQSFNEENVLAHQESAQRVEIDMS